MSQQPEELPHAIGRRLAARRESAGIRQADLARSAAISPAYLNQIEGGERTPTIPVLLRLADAVECRPCELLRDDTVSV